MGVTQQHPQSKGEHLAGDLTARPACSDDDDSFGRLHKVLWILGRIGAEGCDLRLTRPVETL